MRILVAEDERELNSIIAKRLADEDYAVDSVFDGKNALEYMLTTSYDIVLLDVMMPGMDGFEVLKRYRAEGGTSPVLFLTARDAVSDRVRGLDSGGDDYLVKQFLMRNEGAVLSRKSIREHIWSWDYDGESNVVDVYIRYLRKKIDDGESVKLIHTVRGSGYMIKGEGI